MTVDAIKDAILALPERDRLLLEDWLSDQWDEQMARDFSPGGRGAAAIAHVDTEIAAGQFVSVAERENDTSEDDTSKRR